MPLGPYISKLAIYLSAFPHFLAFCPIFSKSKSGKAEKIIISTYFTTNYVINGIYEQQTPVGELKNSVVFI